MHLGSHRYVVDCYIIRLTNYLYDQLLKLRLFLSKACTTGLLKKEGIQYRIKILKNV